MKKLLAALCVVAMTSPAFALTLSTGQVVGADGNVYTGASPEQEANIVAAAQNRGEMVGVSSGNVFVIVGESVTYIPVQEIAGKTDETILATVGNAVIQNVTGNEDLTFASVQAAQELSAEAGVPIEELVSAEGLEGLDPEMLAEIQKVSNETGVSMENLSALNDIIGDLPVEEIDGFVDELESLVADGFADEINEFLDTVRDLGVQDFFSQYTGVDECVAAGEDPAACNAAGEAIDNFNEATQGGDEG